MTDEEKIYQLIKTGNLENIELALTFAKSNRIKLDLDTYLQLYNWLVEYEVISESNKKTSKKLEQLFSIESLNLHVLGAEGLPDFLAHLINISYACITTRSPFNTVTQFSQLGYLSFLPNWFWKWEKLKVLDLKFNSLVDLPLQIEKMPKIHSLLLESNFFKKIPNAIFHLPDLKRLSLSNNEITNMQGDWQKLENLHWLVLGHNQISKIPSGFSKLQNLTLLDLKKNNLGTIPNELFDMASLSDLDLSSNKITKISKDIVNLKNITDIRLNNNKLTTIPDEIFEMPSLKKLNLNNNCFSNAERQRIRYIANEKSFSNLYI